MGLTQAQKAVLRKGMTAGGGDLGVALSREACAYLLALIASDLDLPLALCLNGPLPDFLKADESTSVPIAGTTLEELFEELLQADPNVDTYFTCLATLHKQRLKYAQILSHQPLPTMDQVGPRCLLQFGTTTPSALANLLIWRKWIYDIDNRAAQETGYLFEPIIARAVGGIRADAKGSPVKRHSDPSKGRQVDCIINKSAEGMAAPPKAYEIKIRLTIAASGQGRWKEEMEFPLDCRHSSHVPVLVVLDPTANPKLELLRRAFLDCGGEVYVGEAAWSHLEGEAGLTMSRFLEKYVRAPIEQLLEQAPEALEPISFELRGQELIIRSGTGELVIPRPPDLPAEIE